METFVLALDQGTSSSRAIVFDHAGNARGAAQQELTQSYPHPGWVEHDPREIWTTQLNVARAALARAGVRASNLTAVGIANQRETTVLWDRRSGHPLHPAIVWQDRRTSDFCDALKRAGHADFIQTRTGLVVDAYFSASKLAWLLDHVPGARARAQRGELAFGTVDSWLLWNLTGGKTHATDSTNASRTMLFNLARGDWDEALLELFNVPREVLPAIRPSGAHYGETAPGVLDTPVPVCALAGDQQAALFGQNCVQRGMAKNTYGTGCFMLLNVGDRPVLSRRNLLATVGWALPDRTDYALEGSVFIGGAVVQWLRDGLGIVRSSAEIEALAASVPDSGGVYLVPAFAGLGAPHWDQYARGTITGLTRGATRAHLARAALEGIAFQVADVLDVMKEDAGLALSELRVDGGAAANNLLMQFQADILGVPVICPRVVETTALGAAYLAGLTAGFWKDLPDVQTAWSPERCFEPRMPPDEVAHRRSRWAEALNRARDWEEHSQFDGPRTLN